MTVLNMTLSVMMQLMLMTRSLSQKPGSSLASGNVFNQATLIMAAATKQRHGYKQYALHKPNAM